ncbi:U2 small nuclear ribonucleoprotein auxiliary factor 35 kDa subunit-related protein 2-like [Achroia grisella]|uniref:U2 small nuclear ribonucleoprotein auxiliary factor 35 kDa subunit-related protein 2-like n=1 Tax=Achroia grisella TaxID=688607 RepID=UPI0027D2361E|nr:U2 small nuclear ribonucleoprotein auxiliary factor 35 kDa subunit-related protein 2-like [Achroia grisella]
MLIMTVLTMGRHKEWRKIVKRERRRKLRIYNAKQRDYIEKQSSNEYINWLKEQEAMDLFEYEQIEKRNAEENQKWIEAEKKGLEKWKQLQEKKEIMLQKQLEVEMKLKLEMQLEQEKKKQEMEQLRQLEEANKRKQEIFMNHLQEFLSGHANEPPTELLVSHESRPNTEFCPFFTKTASCRFGDQCSRNHCYPGISKVLLAPNFYVHFGLNNANYNEYDTDVMLEYEDNDTYKEFKDFFLDVLPEFEKFGRVVQFKVCNNYEKHLRGNTYIEFEELRCAVAAYQSLHTRWYGGRQLSLQFCTIDSWKNAICGLQSKRRCPKGRACNFLHVFRNPNNLFSSYNNESKHNSHRIHRSPRRSWRWSESPEVDISRREIDKKNNTKITETEKHGDFKYHKKKYRRKDRDRRSRRQKD